MPQFAQSPFVLRIAANTRGRDFVVGDIHGAYRTLVAAMDAANFDGSVDRLFSVGDLVDRGAQSERCLEFLSQPYTCAVRGNHEQMFLDMYQFGEPSEAELRVQTSYNGMEWWLLLSLDERKQFLRAFEVLPLAIELETLQGPVGIVHAEVPRGMNWQDFLEELEAGNRAVAFAALWGRERVTGRDEQGREVGDGMPDESGVPGIDRVFVGHTVHPNGAHRYGNVFALDTGAVFGELGGPSEGRLTLANVLCPTSELVSPRALAPFDVRDIPLVANSDAPMPPPYFSKDWWTSGRRSS
jgi:serine/threonine protein phosphatase 1